MSLVKATLLNHQIHLNTFFGYNFDGAAYVITCRDNTSVLTLPRRVPLASKLLWNKTDNVHPCTTRNSILKQCHVFF